MMGEELSPGPSCCIGTCCGIGSYCCGHPDNEHEHTKEEELESGVGIPERRYPLSMDFEDGKYTLKLHEGGIVTADRYGEPWRDFVGDKFMVNVARKLFELGDNE